MCSRLLLRSRVVSATHFLLSAAVLFPSVASADHWLDSFVFDACSERTLVDVELLGKTTTVPFDRTRHAVQSGTPVFLTIRYPKLFTSYRVLIEALEVPDALPRVRGEPLSSIDLGEQALPVTKGAQDIATIVIEPATIESVIRGFLTRESARQLIQQIQSDRQKIVDGVRTVATDLRELHEAVEPVLGVGLGGPPHDRVPSLTRAFADLRGELKVPERDFCRFSHAEKKKRLVDANERREIGEWIASTDRLIVNHQYIGERWRSAGVDGLLDRVVRDAEDLDTRMNQFLDNLRVHGAALKLLGELVEDNAGPHLSPTTLRDRWVLDFANRLDDEYSDVRTPEELRAVTERFAKELAATEDSHIAWLRVFGLDLQKVLREGAATVGPTGRDVCGECVDGTAVTILRNAMARLQREIDRASLKGCCANDTPNLRHAVHTAVVRAMAARAAINRELSRLNGEAARLLNGINRILAHSRGRALKLSLGVYDRNSVVTFRVFEQTTRERYAVVPATVPETVSFPQGGGVRADETGATTADAAGEGFRFVGEGIFEVHRTYRLAAFGAFAWTRMRTMEYRARKLDSGTYVASEVGISTAQMSYVVGAKIHPWERDLFPGSGNWLQPGFFFGVPIDSVPGALFGLSWGPYGGVELLAGAHWAKHTRLDKGITLGVTALEAPENRRPSVPVHDEHRVKFFLGVSLDSNIFSNLFGAVAKVGGPL